MPSGHAPKDRHPPKLEDALSDLLLMGLVEAVEAGDQEAVKALHRQLAELLRNGSLSEYAMDLLAGMHESIAAGLPADRAMLTRSLPHRGTGVLRNSAIVNFIDAQIALSTYVRYNPERARHLLRDEYQKLSQRPKLTGPGGLFSKAAKRFGVSAKTVENIYRAHPDK